MRSVLVSLVLALPTTALAGVTIHYSGSLSRADRAGAVLAAAKEYAVEHQWRVSETPDELVLYPAEWCEPVHLKFDGPLLVADFVKTQYAGAAVHRDVVGLFRKLAPRMRKLTIDDESGYWDEKNYANLEAKLFFEAEIIARSKRRRGGQGPVKLHDGRIVDIIR